MVFYVGNGLIPKGTIGVIVHVYRDGLGYEIEFEGGAVFAVLPNEIEADDDPG
jgi:hypothetical protein